MTKEYNYSNNNKDGENDINKGKAKNCNNGSYNSSDIDNDDFRDSNSSNSNSSDSNKGNKAYGYTKRWELLVLISSRLKPKYTVKYCL